MFKEVTEVSVMKGNETIQRETKVHEDMLILNQKARKLVKRNTRLILEEIKTEKRWKVRVYRISEKNPGLVFVRKAWL